MEKLSVRQDVALIFIVTENLKARLLEEFTNAEADVQREIEQFDFRAKHALAELQRADLNRAMAARQQIEVEKRRLDAVKAEILQQKQEIEALSLGSEYPRGTVEGVVEVTQGDNLFEKLAGSQLIVRDGVIIEIRKRSFTEADVIIPQQQILTSGQ